MMEKIHQIFTKSIQCEQCYIKVQHDEQLNKFTAGKEKLKFEFSSEQPK